MKTRKQLDNENFRRQTLTLAKKGNRLKEAYDADVFILVRRKGKLTVYTSCESLDDPQWPLLPEKIKSYYPLPTIQTHAKCNVSNERTASR